MAKHYDTEFKNDAVQYYLNNKDHLKVTEMDSNLGISTSTLQKWVRLRAVVPAIMPVILKRKMRG
ncbi:transposase [Ligilactobacillus equi]